MRLFEECLQVFVGKNGVCVYDHSVKRSLQLYVYLIHVCMCIYTYTYTYNQVINLQDVLSFCRMPIRFRAVAYNTDCNVIIPIITPRNYH